MSLNDSLEYRLAAHYVDDFADHVMKDHYAAMESYDCQELMEKGILAFEWLDRAEKTIREASYLGIVDFTVDAKESVEKLYGAWLNPCVKVDQWLDNLLAQGYRPANVDRFQECKAEVADRTQRKAWASLARKARLKRLAEEAP